MTIDGTTRVYLLGSSSTTLVSTDGTTGFLESNESRCLPINKGSTLRFFLFLFADESNGPFTFDLSFALAIDHQLSLPKEQITYD